LSLFAGLNSQHKWAIFRGMVQTMKARYRELDSIPSHQGDRPSPTEIGQDLDEGDHPSPK